MEKRYKKIVNEISSLEQKIESVSIRKSEAEQRIDEAKSAVKTLSADLKTALVSDDQKKAGTLEKKISELSDKIINRDRLLVEALGEKLPKLDAELAELRQNKNKCFTKLAEKWLQAEASLYDSAAKVLIEKVKRLLIVHSELREIGAAEVYKQVLGQGYEHLPAARIPKLKDFSKQEFISGNFRSGPEIRNKVMQEITG